MSTDFWAQFGALSPVDWCEPNYVYSAYVAEWWNTLSSLGIVSFGLFGWWKANRPRLAFGYLLLAIVGLGSAAFHGTLLKTAQASDELPMILTGLVFAYILARRNDAPARPAYVAALVGYGAAVLVAYFTLKAYFHFFLIAYALILAYLTVGTWRVSGESKTARRYFWASVGAYLGGFAFLWIPEHFLLACSHPLQRLQLHAIFHLTSSFGSFMWLRLLSQSAKEPANAWPTPLTIDATISADSGASSTPFR
jgi:dihydroceramidase